MTRPQWSSCRARATLALATLTIATLARPQKSYGAEPDEKRFGVGLEVTWLGMPKGHLGLMLGGNDGFALTGQIVGRYQLLRFAAIDAGFGLPHAAMGAAGWAAFEVSADVRANQGRSLVFGLYEKTGAQLGYAGPDYFARRDNSFVGYGYTAAGPLAFALRLPVGACLRWAGGTLDSYVEVVPIIALTPSPEVFYNVAFGTRVRF